MRMWEAFVKTKNSQALALLHEDRYNTYISVGWDDDDRKYIVDILDTDWPVALVDFPWYLLVEGGDTNAKRLAKTLFRWGFRLLGLDYTLHRYYGDMAYWKEYGDYLGVFRPKEWWEYSEVMRRISEEELMRL